VFRPSADLRAATQMGLDIKIFRMNRLGIPQDRIAKRAGVNQVLIHNHLLKMATLPNLINADLSRGFTVAQVETGWSQTVNHMAKIDAPNIRPYEIKQIINFLVNQQERQKKDKADEVAQEIGKTLLQKKCTLCHDLERVITASKTETEAA
jgi:hypothetical protein